MLHEQHDKKKQKKTDITRTYNYYDIHNTIKQQVIDNAMNNI